MDKKICYIFFNSLCTFQRSIAINNDSITIDDDENYDDNNGDEYGDDCDNGYDNDYGDDNDDDDDDY